MCCSFGVIFNDANLWSYNSRINLQNFACVKEIKEYQMLAVLAVNRVQIHSFTENELESK